MEIKFNNGSTIKGMPSKEAIRGKGFYLQPSEDYLEEGNLKVGSKLKAKWTETLVDHVTKDRTYEVAEVSEVGFHIINDKGDKCFPISTTFTRIS